MFCLLCSIYNKRGTVTVFVVLFLVSTPYLWLLPTALVWFLIPGHALCVTNRGKGRARQPHLLTVPPPAFVHLAPIRLVPGPIRVLEPRFQVRLVQGPALSGRVFPGGVKPQAHEPHPHRPWCLLPWPQQAPLAARRTAARNVWVAPSLWPTWKGCWCLVGPPFPLSSIRFWFSLCLCFQRSRKVANIFKDQWEPPVNLTSSLESTLSPEGKVPGLCFVLLH